MALSFGLLVIRVIIGFTLAAHGSQKLFGWFGGGGLEGTAQMLERQGYRPGNIMALLVCAGEVGGGVLLALGFLTPLAAAAGVGVMLNAIVSVHLSNGFWSANRGYEFPLVIAAAFAGIGFTGPGRYSLDAAIGWHQTSWVWGLLAVLMGVASGVGALALRSRNLRTAGQAS
ncbi:MAG: DoxX family protein [Micromonosporaceae bacterium]